MKLFEVGIDIGMAAVVSASEKGIEVRWRRDGRQQWLPRSAVHPSCEMREIGDSGRVKVWAWFLEKTEHFGKAS